MTDALLFVLVVLLVAALILLVLLLRSRPVDLAPLASRVDGQMQGVLGEVQSSERRLRSELETGRQAADTLARSLREELGRQLAEGGRAQIQTLDALSQAQKRQLDTVREQLEKLVASNESKLEKLRESVDQRLKELQDDNAKKLDKMRETVDEKLQGALEKRLGESFKAVSERLEQVHRGLGEMHTLASGVGDLKRVLTNVKTRGTWGEVQLGSLLEQVLAPIQFRRSVQTKPGSADRVDFAIVLPGKDDGPEVLLPIDAKFPQEDYLRLVEASERGDVAMVESASRALEDWLRAEAADVQEKYLNPPRTTDFAVLYLPTEGLFAEVVKRPGLTERLQRDCRVTFAGPTTLFAFLSSLQMGFHTLAIQKRSSEVWQLLEKVKRDFGKFGDVVDKVKEKLDQASRTLEVDVAQRTRVIQRSLRDVKSLDTATTPPLLLGEEAAGESETVSEVET
jgi:DNA recombination protein RmuC